MALERTLILVKPDAMARGLAGEILARFELVSFITSGPTLALALEGEGAIATARSTIGATNPADATPGSIRGDFALAMPDNLVHGSDSPESAERELALWFSG